MASSYAPAWRRWLHSHAPFLFRVCPGRNYHWAWERICRCCVNECFEGHRGGAYDLWTGQEIEKEAARG